MRSGMMIPVLLVSAVLGGCAAAGNDEETRTIELAHLKPEQAQLLLEPYLGGGARIRATERPPAVTITTRSRKLDQLEELLRRYDVPSPGVRLRFQIIEADGFTTSDSAIAEVEAALRDLFRFRGYRLVAEALAAGSSNSSTRHLMVGQDDLNLDLMVDVGQVIANDRSKAAELHVTLQAPGRGVLLESNVTVPHGQTVVLGTARPFPNMGALILVVRPEIQ
jgi:type II secretory pathway component GspD/PulD (secretin)